MKSGRHPVVEVLLFSIVRGRVLPFPVMIPGLKTFRVSGLPRQMVNRRGRVIFRPPKTRRVIGHVKLRSGRRLPKILRRLKGLMMSFRLWQKKCRLYFRVTVGWRKRVMVLTRWRGVMRLIMNILLVKMGVKRLRL